MGDQQNSVATGILGHLPPWPRNALNNSVIAAEQAYRQRKGLPLLTEEDMAALRAGEPMPWERGDGNASAASPGATAPAPAAPAAPPAPGAAEPQAAVPSAPSSPTGGQLSPEVQEQVAAGKKWSKSAIAAEQARRGRKGLPALNEAEVAALLGEPEATPAAAAAPPAPAVASAPVAAAPTGPISDEVKQQVAAGKKWSKSAIAAEQARRGRKGLPALNEAEVAALLGEPAAAPAAAPPAAAAPASAPARPGTAAAAPMRVAVPVAPSTRTGDAVRYVGTPAVGTSKAAAAGGLASAGPQNTEVDQRRRQLAWSCIAAFLLAWFVAFFRFFLPRTLFEPSTSFKIGSPSDFALGVDEKFLQKYRIWVDRTPERLFVIYARCTHLGCTPDWKPAENKFKCPCHGSGYDSEGVNFEGPAPRPMDRAHVEISPDGQIQVDTSKLYSWPKGQPSQFSDPGAFLSV
jgi:cytochrome b6-f complex iron-sulfur subunit